MLESDNDIWILSNPCSLLHPNSESQFTSLQWLSCVWYFAIPWTAACQASLSITNSWSSLKFMSIKLVTPFNHFILCCPLLLPSIFPSIKVFSNESVLHIRWPKYWSFSSALVLPHPYMTTGKTIALARQTFVDKVMSLLFNSHVWNNVFLWTTSYIICTLFTLIWTSENSVMHLYGFNSPEGIWDTAVDSWLGRIVYFPVSSPSPFLHLSQ